MFTDHLKCPLYVAVLGYIAFLTGSVGHRGKKNRLTDVGWERETAQIKVHFHVEVI